MSDKANTKKNRRFKFELAKLGELNDLIDSCFTIPDGDYPKWVTTTHNVKSQEDKESYTLSLDCLIDYEKRIAEHSTDDTGIKVKPGTSPSVVRKMYLYNIICNKKPRTICSNIEYIWWLLDVCHTVINQHDYTPDNAELVKFRDKIKQLEVYNA